MPNTPAQEGPSMETVRILRTFQKLPANRAAVVTICDTLRLLEHVSAVLPDGERQGYKRRHMATTAPLRTQTAPRERLIAELGQALEHVTAAIDIAADIDDRNLDQAIYRLRDATIVAGVRAVRLPAY